MNEPNSDQIDDGTLPAVSAKGHSAPFFDITMLPAGHGDALWIEYGRKGGATSRVLVDCGTTASFTHLKARILKVPPAQRHFDLFLMSHIDSDHIGGALPFLAQHDALEVRFDDIWFNGQRHLRPANRDARMDSVHQGEVFSDLITSNALPWNKWQKGKAIVRADNAAPSVTLRGGMKITLLSPTKAKLLSLADTWNKGLADTALEPAEALRPSGAAQTSETSEDVAWLADLQNHPFNEDAAAPNGSSIAVLAEFAGKVVLLGADAHPSLLEQAIQTLLASAGNAPAGEKKLHLDAFKVSHHGSQNNLSPALLKLISCRNFLISTNGAVFNHPDRVAVARIINAGVKPPQLWFNYRSEDNEVWAKPALQNKYKYNAVFATEEESGLTFSMF